ncbi:polysaccharide biosynthesis protein [Bacteroidales bacterium OttesenSCG-928-M06]|nr:polysaccharide biosynthesis protein [Bacteroidales bacterium OttesenSCG-928-M06]
MEKLLNSILAGLEKVPLLPRWIIFCIDILIVFSSFTLAYLICYSFVPAANLWNGYVVKALLTVGITAISFFVFETYSGVIRYAGFRDVLRVFLSLFCSNATLLLIGIVFHQGHDFLIVVIGFLLNFLFSFVVIVLFRMCIRVLFDYVKAHNIANTKIPVLIYRVESSSISMARLMIHSDKLKYKPIGFISPEQNIVSKRVFDLPVYYIGDIFLKKKIKHRYEGIVIIPEEINPGEKQQLAAECMKYKKELLSAPLMDDWSGKVTDIKTLNKVKIEDLLQRIPIQIDIESIGESLDGKIILITGAAGSIGSEIVRQVSKFKIAKLLLCDVAESPLHEISIEIKDKCPSVECIPLLIDVRNIHLIESVFEQYEPNVVYHAAAYKHVPLLEEYPTEAILTNVLGSKNVVDLSVKYKAEVFVMVSTDKAVNPSNVMGASKLIAEVYVQSLAQKLKKDEIVGNTRIITTRFGNVLGSNGSVIPRFEQQIAKGGPVTVTHPEIIRYFMTIPEACRLVLDAGSFGKGGEVFVFDMGESVKIKDLAEEMIRLSGLKPYEDIDIVYTGLRPGEKLYEELLYEKEKVKPTHNSKIKIATVKERDYDEIKDAILELIKIATTRDKKKTVQLMKEIAPEFVSQNSAYCQLDNKNFKHK